MKTAISEMTNTLEVINSRLDKAENQISDLEGKVQKHPVIAAKIKLKMRMI